MAGQAMTEPGMLAVTVVARQRLALGTGSEVSFFTGSHAFVPGSVLRGALAAAWIAEHGPPAPGSSEQAWFRDLFDGPVRYGPLHVPGSFVQPVSVRRCKYPKNGACEDSVVDAAFDSRVKCLVCEGPTEPGKGQVTLPPGITLDRLTRTSINPKTGKAADGELYSHGALPAGTRLEGVIRGRDPWLERPRRLRLGGRRTVGGAADYQVEPIRVPGPAVAWEGTGPLVIRLTSPGVFVDVAGRPQLAPDRVLDLDGAEVERSWARPVTWTGWHAASTLPKPEELCAVTGSTYRLTGSAQVLRGLVGRLPTEGAGLRRTEGFGGIEVVTGPWRPPGPVGVPGAGEQAAGGDGGGAEAPALALLASLQELRLNDGQRRWVISALGDLQRERERPASGPPPAQGAEDLAGFLLGQPAALDLAGRQREELRKVFREEDSRLLRDVATLLAVHPTRSREEPAR
jgi:CRISPR-associated protein Csx10